MQCPKERSCEWVMTWPSKLTTIGTMMSSTMYWLLDPVKNATRSARTLAAYKALVSMITMKAGKSWRDPPDMTEGARWMRQAIKPDMFWSLVICRSAAEQTYWCR
jgi:hypothetical protein